MNELRRKYYKRDREKILAYNKEHQEEIKLKRREYFRKYYLEHKSKQMDESI